ncbi:MAG: di-trans,poly-cis-decaprenylcistransferase [Firmicutes bacterium]|nr:di-trans,poly-cis-decaprenylcistransferase [Bacillota bacterium]
MHVAIIMDGNGRWASRQGLPRLSGHAVGSRKAEEIVKIAQDIGIRHITLYVFSTENWKRPRKEVEGLMSLLVELFERRLQDLINYGANIKIIGRRDRLPGPVLAAIINAENKTADNERIFVNLAIDYGGRDEIRRAVQELVMKALMGKIEADAISEEDISLHLYTAGSPDPDLIIRTGGEMRMSNFLTWQSAYSELVVTSRLWPDFSKGDLLLAILEYQRRKRKFGGL